MVSFFQSEYVANLDKNLDLPTEKMEGTEKYANNQNYLHYGYPVNMDSNINIFIAEK